MKQQMIITASWLGLLNHQEKRNVELYELHNLTVHTIYICRRSVISTMVQIEFV